MIIPEHIKAIEDQLDLPNNPTSTMKKKRLNLIAKLIEWEELYEEYLDNPEFNIKPETNTQIAIGDNNIQTNE